jgi:two-component system phosphate regulon sensor histidine kinase PhoR
MNYYLLSALIVLIIAIGGLAIIYSSLRRRLARYNRTVRRISEDELPVSGLPEDEKGLEDLSNAVKTLAIRQQVRYSSLDAERARLAAVLDRMTDGVLITDAAGMVQFANPAAESLFGVDHAIGHTLVEVVRQHKLVETWQRGRETGQPQEESVELPTGHQFLQLVVLPDQQTGGSLLLVQNLTRVRRLETVRRDFISNVSHELRTPLASLKALTETLRDGALDDPKAAHRFLGRMETEVDALTQMAQELLDLTRIESGQVPLELKAVPAAGLLSLAADRMRAQAERAGLVIRLGTPQDITEVWADPSRLEQVLVNLIHNAVKFTRPGGEVVLSAQIEGEVVRFAVKDTGVGIPADDLERIFERFYKADRARSGGGTGLGLSISRHIIEAHGGRIWVESEEGRGSTFYFTIPVAS